jgi:outer membrane receptor protein involved in Fe transport
VVNVRHCSRVLWLLVFGVAVTGAGEVVVLSPFEVRDQLDRGYGIGAAVTGTGIAGLIKDTPLNVSLVSQELMRDQAGHQLVDVLRNASSVAVHVKDEYQILIRGYTGPQFVNGLPAGQGLALYDVDRIEVVKGPNAVFAGISNPGGTINLIKLKPSFAPRHSLELSIGSFAHNRVVLRTSAPLVKGALAYGFVFGATDERSWTDDMFMRENFLGGALTWKPAARLTFTLRGSQLDREAGRRPNLSASHPLFQQRDREAIELFDQRGMPRPANYPQLENGAARNAAGEAILTGRVAPETVDAFIARTLGPDAAPYVGVYTRELLGRENANYNGPDGRDNYRNETIAFNGEWLTSRALALRGTFQQVDSHRMRREFNGLRPVAGQRLRSSVSDYKPGGVTFAARFDAAGKLELGKAGRHDLLAGFQHDGGKDVISPITIATTRVVTYDPRTQPRLGLLQLLREQYGATYEEPGVVRKGGAHTNAFFGVAQSSFVGDRLRTLIGGRRVAHHRPIDDNRDGIDEDFVTHKVLPHYAALVRVAPAVSLYAATVVPQRQQTADLEAIRATQGDPASPGYRPPAVIPPRFLAANLIGRGWETGAKLDFAGGRLLGTLTYFANEESSRLDIDTTNQVLYQLPGGTVRTAAGETRARGIESEWHWTPAENYEALLSASYFFQKNEITNPAEPREAGSHLESVPRFTINLWNKYAFTRGVLHGCYVGGGATALGETYVHPSWTVPIVSEPVVLLDAIIGRAIKIRQRSVDLRLNARNVFNKHYLNGTFQSGEPRMVIFTTGVRF